MSSGGRSQHYKGRKKEVILLMFRPFIVWKTTRVPFFISKDSHYSTFSAGTHLSLSRGNLVHRTQCPRGAQKDDRWRLYEQAQMNSAQIPLHTLPHSQFSKTLPDFSEEQDLSPVFRAHRVFKFLFHTFCLNN